MCCSAGYVFTILWPLCMCTGLCWSPPTLLSSSAITTVKKVKHTDTDGLSTLHAIFSEENQVCACVFQGTSCCWGVARAQTNRSWCSLTLSTAATITGKAFEKCILEKNVFKDTFLQHDQTDSQNIFTLVPLMQARQKNIYVGFFPHFDWVTWTVK